MTHVHTRLLAVGLLAACAGILGCDREAEVTPRSESVGAESSAEGLSRDEIRMRAEPMSPEQAEQLGIVDTTIHLESLADSDSLARPGPTPDSAR